MTKIDKMVSMKGFGYDDFRDLLDQFLGTQDGEDPKVVKKRKILQAAVDLFVHHGYRKTSISDIANRAGVAKGTVYLYYQNKPEILIHAVADEKARYIGEVKPILDPGLAPRERLKRWIAMVFRLGSRMPLTSRLLDGDPEFLTPMFAYLDNHQDEGWEQMQEAFIRQMVEDALGDHRLTGIEVGDRVKVLASLPYVARVFLNERIRRGLSMERFADLLATLIVDGLGASNGAV